MDSTEKLINLHINAFGDSREYADFFFSTRYLPENAFFEFEGNEPVGVVYARYISLVIAQKKLSVPFLTGIATAESHRGRGIARRNLEKALASFTKRNAPFVLLSPSDDGFYRKLGYESISYCKEIKYSVRDDIKTVPFENTEKSAKLFAEAYAASVSGLYGYAERAEKECADIIREHIADGGTGEIFIRDGKPVGYALREYSDSLFAKEFAFSGDGFVTSEDADAANASVISNTGKTAIMGATDSPELLLKAIPVNSLADTVRFAVENTGYEVSSDGCGAAIVKKIGVNGLKTIPGSMLLAAMLGNADKYKDFLPDGFSDLYPPFNFYILEKY